MKRNFWYYTVSIGTSMLVLSLSDERGTLVGFSLGLILGFLTYGLLELFPSLQKR